MMKQHGPKMVLTWARIYKPQCNQNGKLAKAKLKLRLVKSLLRLYSHESWACLGDGLGLSWAYFELCVLGLF